MLSKIPALIILIGLGLCSGYLTWEMMIDLGGSLGSPLVFGVAGVFLELAKAYLPMQASWTFQNGKWIRGAAFSGLSVALIAISFVASFNTMQEGIQRHQAASVANTQIMAQIESLEALKASQLAVNHVTKAGNTAKEISELYTRLGTEKATELSKHQTLVFGIIAAAIELVGLAMALIVSEKKAASVEKSEKRIRSKENQKSRLAVAASIAIASVVSILSLTQITGQGVGYG